MKAELNNGSIKLIPENSEDQKSLQNFREHPELANSGKFWGLKKNSNGEMEIYLSEQHNRSHKKFEITAVTQPKKKFEIINPQ